MSNDLERLDNRLQETFALAMSRLWRRQVRIKEGPHMGARGEVTSVSLGSRGQIVASVRLDERHPRRPHLNLPLLDVIDPRRSA